MAMDGYMHQLIQYIFPKNCFDELVIHFNVAHEECMKLVLSRVLSFGIIVGSVLVKVPQIVKIVGAKSGQGVATLSQLCELCAATATMVYSYDRKFPFSAWGEALFLSIQTMIIVSLIFYYEGRSLMSALFVVFYCGVTYFLMSGRVPSETLIVIQSLNIPITVSAKLIQALANYRNESTGQLSWVTVMLMFGGSLARIFTSQQETGDKLTIIIFVISSLMNGIIVAQLFIYAGKKPKDKKLMVLSVNATVSIISTVLNVVLPVYCFRDFTHLSSDDIYEDNINEGECLVNDFKSRILVIKLLAGLIVLMEICTSIIIYQILCYEKALFMRKMASIFAPVHCFLSAFLLSGWIRKRFLRRAMGIAIVVQLGGRIYQVIRNRNDESTGQLSLVASILLVIRSISKIILHRDTGDFSVILLFVVSLLVNLCIVCQILADIALITLTK